MRNLDLKMTTVERNHVFVTPTEETGKFLQPWIQQCPFQDHVELPRLKVSIVYAKTPLINYVPDSTRVYECRIKGAQMWYDVYLGIRDFVVLVDCDDLIKRQVEILQQSTTESVYSTYEPHFTLAYNVPPASRKKYRWWVNDIINKFSLDYVGKSLPFSNEQVASSSGYVTPSTKVVTRNPEQPVEGL